MSRLLTIIRDNFNITKKTEFTVESSPETITSENIDILLSSGVNRLSIGAQTFDDKILKLLNRRHDSKQTIDAFNLARNAGVKNINLDIIRSLPDMPMEKLIRDLKQIEELRPESLSSYHLVIKPNAGIKSLYTKERSRFPESDESFKIHLTIMEWMQNLGYQHNPIDWFYLDSKAHVHALDKWERMINSLSFGVSAYAYVNGTQYFNKSILEDYLSDINSEKPPLDKGIVLSKEEQMHRKFIFGLKTKIEKDEFINEFGNIPDPITKRVKEYVKLGLIHDDGRIIKLTEKGALLADEICTKFYSDDIKKQLRDQWFEKN